MAGNIWRCICGGSYSEHEVPEPPELQELAAWRREKICLQELLVKAAGALVAAGVEQELVEQIRNKLGYNI